MPITRLDEVMALEGESGLSRTTRGVGEKHGNVGGSESSAILKPSSLVIVNSTLVLPNSSGG
ncbi:MAG: hypothetical protein ACK5PB_20620 [Pirellula sp.]